MRYFLDTEFDGFGGELMSLALVREDGASLYLLIEGWEDASDPWVRANVLPIMEDCPAPVIPHTVSHGSANLRLQGFFAGDPDPEVIADWPDDIAFIAPLLLTGPGTMIDVPSIRFAVVRVDAYPTTLPGAVQHNAWWDAMALRHLLLSSQHNADAGGEAVHSSPATDEQP